MNKRILVAALALGFSGLALAQSQAVRDQLFGPTDALKKSADAIHAKMLGPDSYEQAMELYKEAGDTLAKGKDINSVKEDLSKADGLFKKSADAAKLAQVTFADTLTARTAAEKAEAAKYAAKDWGKGEAELKDAAQQLEEGNLNKAQKTGQDATEYYKSAEAKAVNEKAKAAHK
jgi:OmpA-OmpF porin, OOP family